MTWEDTGLGWVQTSPNIPKASSVVYYAATSIYGSLSGSGFDVGIGTGSPFEMAGACRCDGGKFTTLLRGEGIPCGPYSREEFGGARLNLTADSDVNLTGINVHLLAAVQRQKEGSIFARYKDADNIFWKVYGSTDIRNLLEKGTNPSSIVSSWAHGVSAFRSARQGYLIY
jgi:uncharacterized protein YbbC (DUF1343 family)